jgi:hypothetical protein
MTNGRGIHPKAKTWRSFMPKRGNGGVPYQEDVDAFVQAAKAEPEIRQKVLSELREVSHSPIAILLGMLSAGLTSLGVIVAIVGKSVQSDADALLQLLYGVGGGVLAIVVLTFILLIWAQARTRHAQTWLRAYEDALP